MEIDFTFVKFAINPKEQINLKSQIQFRFVFHALNRAAKRMLKKKGK